MLQSCSRHARPCHHHPPAPPYPPKHHHKQTTLHLSAADVWATSHFSDTAGLENCYSSACPHHAGSPQALVPPAPATCCSACVAGLFAVVAATSCSKSICCNSSCFYARELPTALHPHIQSSCCLCCCWEGHTQLHQLAEGRSKVLQAQCIAQAMHRTGNASQSTTQHSTALNLRFGT